MDGSISQIGRVFYQTTPYSTLGEKICELCSTNKNVLVAHIHPPNRTFFGRLHFGSALGGVSIPLKFLHALVYLSFEKSVFVFALLGARVKAKQAPIWWGGTCKVCGGSFPLPSRLGGLGSVMSPPLGSGRIPDRKRISGVFGVTDRC